MVNYIHAQCNFIARLSMHQILDAYNSASTSYHIAMGKALSYLEGDVSCDAGNIHCMNTRKLATKRNGG